MATVVEFAIVLSINKCTETTKNQAISRGQLFYQKSDRPIDGNQDSNQTLFDDEALTRKLKQCNVTEKIDFASLLLFTSLYITFNTVYFVCYM